MYCVFIYSRVPMPVYSIFIIILRHLIHSQASHIIDILNHRFSESKEIRILMHIHSSSNEFASRLNAIWCTLYRQFRQILIEMIHSNQKKKFRLVKECK